MTRYNFTILFARLCAHLINDSNFNKLGNSKITFQKLLVQKCFVVFSSYETYQQDLAKLKKNFNQHDQVNSKIIIPILLIISHFNKLILKVFNLYNISIK